VDSLATGILCAVALCAGQCQETLRRAMMAHGGQRRALPGDVISYLGQAALVFSLSAAGALTVNRAFAIMAITSIAAVIVQSIQIGPRVSFRLRELTQTGRDFWTLGRWVLMGNLTAIVTTLGCSWTLVYFHGPDAVGHFQALANLMKLSNPLTICMAGLIVPAAARAFRTDGLDAAKSITWKYGALTCGVLAPYFLFLIILPTTSIHLLYGSTSAYAHLGNQLRAFVIWYSALVVAQIAGCLLNAIEQSRRGFLAQAAQTGAIVLIALPLTAIYGLDGLMLGGVIANLVMASAYLSMVRRIEELPIVLHSRKVTHENHAARLAA
jgi:O-antigen/teichoic acid export membrane protein